MRRARLLIAWTLALTACVGANWQPLTIPSPTRLDRKTIIEFRAKGTLVRLHGVEFGSDSVSGVPWLDHLTCDTCRVSYALADVSEPRVGDPGKEAWNLVIPIVAVVGVVGLLRILICGSIGGSCT